MTTVILIGMFLAAIAAAGYFFYQYAQEKKGREQAERNNVLKDRIINTYKRLVERDDFLRRRFDEIEKFNLASDFNKHSRY